MNKKKDVTVMVVDDDIDLRSSVKDVLELEGYTVLTAADGEEGLTAIHTNLPDIVLSDVQMPRKDGLTLVRELKAHPELRYIPAVLLTARDMREAVIEGFNAGADDYISKGSSSEELLARMEAVLRMKDLYSELASVREEEKNLRHQLKEQTAFSNMVGNNDRMQEVFSLIERLRRSEVPVLITGESGTGKELVARAVHYHSRRSDRPLIIQNCSAFQETLLESELFGYKKGAFSGAVKDKKGLFEVADGGTFFLDELGDMPLSLQAKLLRVIQEGTFIPVGSTEEKKVDVRIVAATNKDIPVLIKEGKFREDLYYRLNVIHIHLPPLRERKEDIPHLASHFLKDITEREQYGPGKIDESVMARLIAYDWPGNIRELKNEMERAVILCGDKEVITMEDLQSAVTLSTGNSTPPLPPSGHTLKEAVEDLERHLISKVMEESGGNKSEASRMLGISRSSLIAKVQSYGLE